MQDDFFQNLSLFVAMMLLFAGVTTLITGYIKMASNAITGPIARVVSFLVAWGVPPFLLWIIKLLKFSTYLNNLSAFSFALLAVLIMLMANGIFTYESVKKFLISIGAENPSKVAKKRQ